MDKGGKKIKKIRSLYGRISFNFPFAKEEMEAGKKNMNPKT